MSSQGNAVAWAWNGENYKAAFTAEENKKTNKADVAASSTKRMWAGQATERKVSKLTPQEERFAPTILRSSRDTANSQANGPLHGGKQFDATKAQSYVEAFEVLAPQGKLALSRRPQGLARRKYYRGQR